jgi:hypothetical protein
LPPGPGTSGAKHALDKHALKAMPIEAWGRSSKRSGSQPKGKDAKLS